MHASQIDNQRCIAKLRGEVARMERRMVEQSYIVTDRGGSRSYPTLVTVSGPQDGQLYLKAHEAAAKINSDLADCGKEISAFPISESKRKQWLDLEARYKAAIDGLPTTLAEMRKLQSERQAFLDKLS